MIKDILISKIKEKKELSGLADSIIEETAARILKKHNLSFSFLSSFHEKSKDTKSIIKEVRAELRKYTGRFQVNNKERLNFLKENNIKDLLQTHLSTKERLKDYSKIKIIINSLNVKSILDLGSGLNPIALADQKIRYYSLDINEDEVNLINEFFKMKKIQGKAFIYDIRKIKENELPNADLCLIFKLFDLIETRGHKLAEKIIKIINSRYFLISFPSKTLSGKSMRHPQRGWIEFLLTRLNFSFKSFQTKNEIFYFAEKINLNKTRKKVNQQQV